MKIMNCTDIQPLLDDYLDNDLLVHEQQSIEMHINSCVACRESLEEVMQLRDELKMLPHVEASADFESRVFAQVRKQNTPNHNGRFLSGFVTAMAASVFLWVASPMIFAPQQSMDSPSIISIAMNETRPVRLLFEAPDDIQQVTLSIELPANVELNGYPGRTQLSWNTSLKKGQNVLALPINAIQSGKGELVAQLSYGDKQKTYRLILKTTDNGVMTFEIQPLKSA
jgi:putative zinc finger protein